ncbi:MAG: FecR domain-containing protein [Proteobacteria bacterium]|nr:FecR domain-containing protein [Pseudomonadota bacterium]
MTEGHNSMPAGRSRSDVAAEWYVRLQSDSASEELLSEFHQWLQGDSRNIVAFQRVSAVWHGMGELASAPEIMVARRDALENSRRAARNRWSVPAFRASWRQRRSILWTAAACLMLSLIVAVMFGNLPASKVYSTDLGERRSVLLQDGSTITLDARSRLRVTLTEKARTVVLEQGQARFGVAKDPLRPFRVQAGSQVVTAVGTQFDVELVSGSVLVTLMEGRVVVAGVEAKELGTASPHAHTVDLYPGQRIAIQKDGATVLSSQVDLDRANAWQAGKFFFENEPLGSAVERFNRYSRQRITIDPNIRSVTVSGVFNAGEAAPFIEALTLYFPIKADYPGDSEIHLSPRL